MVNNIPKQTMINDGFEINKKINIPSNKNISEKKINKGCNIPREY